MKKYKPDKTSKNKQRQNPVSRWKTIGKLLFDHICRPIIGAIVLAATFYLVSRYIFFPVPEVRIEKIQNRPTRTIYRVDIRNKSKLEIQNLEISVKFDERYPVSDIDLQEPGLNTGITVKTFENYQVVQFGEGKIKLSETPDFKANGISCATNIFPPGALASISVFIDKSYDGSNGDILPPPGAPFLRSFSYKYTYKYRPFGLFAPVAISGSRTADFDGKLSIADNYRKYHVKYTSKKYEPVKILFDFTRESVFSGKNPMRIEQ